jgi:serine protease
MQGARSLPNLIAAAVVLAATGLLVSSVAYLSAQAGAWNPPYRMLLTPDRALGFVQAADRRFGYVPGEVLIKFKAGVTAAGQERALSALRSRPTPAGLRWVGDVAVWRDPSERDATILAAQLSTQSEVAYAEPNYLRRAYTTPNDPGFAQRQWNLAAIDMPKAWDINPGANDSVIVAVVDTGVTAATASYAFQTWNGKSIQSVIVPFAVNPDLAANRLIYPHDFIFWSGPVLDMVGHGTHVSSTIGEDTNNAIAEAGVAYRVKVMPLKVCIGYWEVQFVMTSSGYQGFVPPDVGGCADSEVAEALRYAADNGAKVVNLSLGGPEPSSTVRDALTYAVGKGAFVSISMGNAYEDGNPVEYPAAYAADIDGVMSVGAVGPSLARAFYSSTGPHIEIAAPGGSDQEGGANGMIWQATIYLPDSLPTSVVSPRFDRYAETPFEGTSMAAPHVAGVAALLASQGVTKPAAIESLIKKTARPLGSAGSQPGRNNEYGYGLVQPRPALYGFGLAK